MSVASFIKALLGATDRNLFHTNVNKNNKRNFFQEWNISRKA